MLVCYILIVVSVTGLFGLMIHEINSILYGDEYDDC